MAKGAEGVFSPTPGQLQAHSRYLSYEWPADKMALALTRFRIVSYGLLRASAERGWRLKEIEPPAEGGVDLALRPQAGPADAVGPAAEVISGADCGINVQPEDEEDMAKAVLELFENEGSLRERLGANGRVCAVERFSRKAIINRFEGLL